MARTHTFRRAEGFNKVLRAIPKEADREVRAASARIAQGLASKAEARARSLGGVADLIAPTIRAGRDRVPLVRMGGSKRLPPREGRARTGPNQTVGNLIWGNEWGSRRFRQFPEPVKRGRVLWSTLHDEYDASMEEWGDAVLAAIDNAAQGVR